jgi:hypothetical protein
MFGRKREDKQPKVKVPSPREITVKRITEEVDALTEGRRLFTNSLIFIHLPDFLGSK